MPTSLELACASCGRPHDAAALVCGLCGHVLRRERASTAAIAAPREPTPPDEAAEVHGREREPWIFLGLGLLTAPVFAWTPLLQYMGWFLASLVHEMGHASVAWLCGMPAVPAISLAGHAAAVHGEQSLALALSVAFALA